MSRTQKRVPPNLCLSVSELLWRGAKRLTNAPAKLHWSTLELYNKISLSVTTYRGNWLVVQPSVLLVNRRHCTYDVASLQTPQAHTYTGTTLSDRLFKGKYKSLKFINIHKVK